MFTAADPPPHPFIHHNDPSEDINLLAIATYNFVITRIF
jgi:hypothetical protein